MGVLGQLLELLLEKRVKCQLWGKIQGSALHPAANPLGAPARAGWALWAPWRSTLLLRSAFFCSCSEPGTPPVYIRRNFTCGNWGARSLQPRLNAGSELFSPAVAAVPLPKKQMPALVGVCKDSLAAQIAFGLLCFVAVLGSDPLTKKEIPLL